MGPGRILAEEARLCCVEFQAAKPSALRLNLMKPLPLHLYEEILLLALRNREGTPQGSFTDYALTGAVLAELQLEGRLGHMQSAPDEVGVMDRTPLGDDLLDEALQEVVRSKKHRTWSAWVRRLSRLPQLRQRAAQRLLEEGVLREDERKILGLFKRKVYPELNPEPEQRLLSDLEAILFEEVEVVSPERATLIALSHASGLLAAHFGKKEIKARGDHIRAIIAGDKLGEATKKAIETLQAAVLISTMIPVILAN